MRLPQLVGLDVGIDGGRGDALMAQRFLDDGQRHPSAEHLRRMEMPECMGVEIRFPHPTLVFAMTHDSCCAGANGDDSSNPIGGYRLALVAEEQRPVGIDWPDALLVEREPCAEMTQRVAVNEADLVVLMPAFSFDAEISGLEIEGICPEAADRKSTRLNSSH